MSNLVIIDPNLIQIDKDGVITLKLSDFETLGKMLKLYRDLRGLSQVDAAELGDIHRGAIIRVESDKGNMSSLQRVLDGYGVDLIMQFKIIKNDKKSSDNSK